MLRLKAITYKFTSMLHSIACEKFEVVVDVDGGEGGGQDQNGRGKGLREIFLNTAQAILYL